MSVSGGGSGNANATDSTTIIVTPAAPTGLSATAGNAQVSLTWNSSTGATSYNVLRSATNGGPYTSIVTGLTAASYRDTGLINGTTYYYVAQAVNSAGTSANSNQASATPSAGSSWSNGYAYRRAVTIDHSKVPNTDQTNFPMLFSGTYSYLATTSNGGNVTNANGYDIIFTSDAGGTSTLPFERETYNASTGAVNFWVKVPTVSHSSDTVFYMFYGNSSVTTDQSNKTGVWDSSFKGVWHLPNGSTLSASDSTSNGNNGTNNGASATTGKIDGGASFNGTSNYIDVPSSSTFGGYGTVSFSAWIKPSQVNVDQVILERPVSTTAVNPWQYWSFGVASSGSVFAAVSSGIAGSRILTFSSGTISANVWTHVYVTYDGSTLRTYINGAVDPTTGSGNITIGSGSTDIGIGQSFISGFEGYFGGLIDEARFSSTARSADWITTEYNNQNSPSTFYTLGVAATSGGAPPAPSVLAATAGDAQVNLTWNASSGAATYKVYRSTINSGPYTNISSTATTGYTDTGLTNGTTYYYVVTAVNANGESGYSNQASATPAISSWSNGYAYRRAITINHLQVPNTDQTNFPMVFSGTYSYLATTSNGGNVTNANGYDIIFTSDAGGTSTIPFERETYNASTGAVNFWVKVPTVSHSSDTVFYMFYGNSSVTTDQSNKTGVWDSNFKGVWHLPNGSTLSASDSTSNGNNGANNGASAATGKIDGGASFNGTSNYIDVPSSSTFGGYGTVSFSAWIKPSQVNVDQVILERPVSTTAVNPWQYWSFGVASSGSVFAAVSSGIAGSRILTFSSGTISANVWTHVYVTYDGSTLRTYINGAVDPTTGSGNITIGSGSTDIGIGQSFISGFEGYFGGLIDEARFSSTARSADWITTEYNNQNSPSTFYTIS